MAKTYKIAVIPGDGIGKEVTPWAQKALEKAAEGVADFEYENFDLGAERYLRDGAILPEDEEERIKANDAILLGAVKAPKVCTAVPAARCAATPRRRWPPRCPSTPHTVWSVWCVTPSSSL